MKTNKFDKIIIPEFIFADGSMGIFDGYDRKCCPDDGRERPKWLWKIGLFDIDGNYFGIEIDARRSERKKTITYILDGKAYYHPIVRFLTYGGKVNPLNGHMVHCKCEICRGLNIEPKNFN